MDSTNKIQKYKKYKSTHNSAIFELQTPDFAWKFIWTVQPNDKVQNVQEAQKVQKYKRTKVQNYERTKVQIYEKVQKVQHVKIKSSAPAISTNKSKKCSKLRLLE